MSENVPTHEGSRTINKKGYLREVSDSKVGINNQPVIPIYSSLI